MKRRHNRQHIIDFCKKVRSLRKGAVFGADIIAGFPTETEDMFQDTIDLIKKCNLTHLHVFPYSIRKNTPAAKMPQIEKDIIKKRARILRQEGKKLMINYLQTQIGNSAMMLVENVKENVSYGKSQHFTKIQIKNSIKVGEIVKCMITNINNDILCGYTI